MSKLCYGYYVLLTRWFAVSKKRFSVSMEEELVDWIDANYYNRSAFLEDVVEQARDGGGAKGMLKEFEKRRIQQKKQSLKAQLQTLEEQEEQIEQGMSAAERQREAKLSEAHEILGGKDVDETHPGVKNWAENCNLTPSKLIEELEARDK